MSGLKKYSLGGSRQFFESEDPQGMWMKAADVEAVIKDVIELCHALEMDVESAPFHKAASAILARLEVRP